MNRLTVPALLLAGSLALASAAEAQQTRWQFTGSLVTGGFTSNLVEDGFTTDVVFDGIGGPIPINDAAINENYSYDNYTGVGFGAEYRKGRIGYSGNLTWIPTRAVAVEPNGQVPGRIARAYGFPVPNIDVQENNPYGPVPIRLKTSQNLVLAMLGVSWYSHELPPPGRPAEPVEYYFSGGLGIVNNLDDEPLTARAGEDLGTPIAFSLGGGLFINFNSLIGLRVDLKSTLWSTEVLGESHMQNSIMFSPGIVILR